MEIVHVASEIAPIAKVGGLADVLYGLARAQIAMGYSTRVFLPFYTFLKNKLAAEHREDLTLTLPSGSHKVAIQTAYIDGIELCLIDSPLFNRDSPYDFNSQVEIDSFLFFSKAVSSILDKQTTKTIVHLHDWPTAAIPLILKETNPNHPHLRTLLTIHNVQFQGKCTADDLERIGLTQIPKSAEDTEFPGKFNLLRAGIELSDQFTTVSPTYAKEIQTPAFGWWLEKIIQKQSHKLTGIINGIDPNMWNPLKDIALHRNYSVSSSKGELLQARHQNKRALQKKVGLPLSHRPLLTSITRLASQKGPELILEAMRRATELDMQYILIGSHTPENLSAEFEKLKGHPNIYMELSFNEPLARLCYSGCDGIVIPSHFEPCGLTQIIGMRYGCIPIVRATGGLKDTVIPCKTGFTFEEATTQAIGETLQQVDRYYSEEPTHWQQLISNGMNLPFGWHESAQKYLEVYERSWLAST